MITVMKFKSQILNQERTIRIFIPDEASGPYQVLYMYDGQNLFDKTHATFSQIWDMETQVNRMLKAGLIPPLMIVGIDSTLERLDEYSPFSNDLIYKTMSDEFRVEPYGDKTNQFIVDELMPFINDQYHTLHSYNHIAGSSLGGLMALHAGLTYPKKFRGVGIFSLAAHFNKPALKQLLQNKQPERNQRYYIVLGTNESNSTSESLNKEYLDVSNTVNVAIRKRVDKVFYRAFKDGKHNENFWASLVPSFLYFLFEK
ncbi:alpha/beta hydrolase [Acholeplasma hippikon]|uniref:Ferri-bacillibactin esterase BesA n=1 Tax=Acholeplasma hippikon TaxID=264636 RepID=A0A449BK80_9MOLU|nr:alpha/beta hydrolase-fold protein [Acholeplasma hippikon]VEU82737.1 Ferri-bacillibactin esterase BesA [Acholeplasma hippikon]